MKFNLRSTKKRTVCFTLQAALLLLVIFGGACKKDNTGPVWPAGTYNKAAIANLPGFTQQRPALLTAAGVSVTEFIHLSTDSAWHLIQNDRNKLAQIRNGITAPTTATIMGKVIPLQDVATYMNNTYGGTVGGFVSVAADLKSLSTMHDIYWGLRLDYPGTKFLPDGAGYAVIRFTSSQTNHLAVPYCTEMGGTKTHAWPNTGGGFTSSTLGDGGVPEYTFDNYYAPNQGAEIYEVTPLGNEILRSTYRINKWVTTEPTTKSASQWMNPVRNGEYGLSGKDSYPVLSFADGRRQILTAKGETTDYTGEIFYVATYTDYQNFKMRVWGYDEKHYLLTTSDQQAFIRLGLNILEKGIYGKVVEIEAVNKLYEEKTQLYRADVLMGLMAVGHRKGFLT